jgi:predicted NBD/HSP70 family sugar kinase
MLMGTNQEVGRPFNKRIVLDLIRRRGPIARTDIARAVGLTVQTVSSLVRELEEDGFVLSGREPPKGRGVPPSRLMVNPEGGFAIGLHLTPLGVEAALVDLGGEVVVRTRRDAEQLGPDDGFAVIRSLVRELAADPSRRILGAGLAMPGPFGVDSMSFVGSTTMAGWQDTDILAGLAAATGLPAFVETDTAAAALGEQLYGRGNTLRDYYYLFFGVGLGGTMVQDGAVLRGHWGNAGEVGHMTVVPGGEPCPCGNRGCLERYVSLEAAKRSGLPEADWVDAVFPVFLQAVRTLENLFDPETIVLGGFVPEALRARVAAAGDLGSSISARRDRALPRLLLTADGGGEAVLRGAAALAVRAALSPREGQLFARAPERAHGRETAPA